LIDSIIDIVDDILILENRPVSRLPRELRRGIYKTVGINRLLFEKRKLTDRLNDLIYDVLGPTLSQS
jgi:hypothetical protein